MKSLLNKSACREYALTQSANLRNGRFTRVSEDLIEELESYVRQKIAGMVHRAPSIGKTLKP
jgi:hypothetical protein